MKFRSCEWWSVRMRRVYRGGRSLEAVDQFDRGAVGDNKKSVSSVSFQGCPPNHASNCFSFDSFGCHSAWICYTQRRSGRSVWVMIQLHRVIHIIHDY